MQVSPMRYFPLDFNMKTGLAKILQVLSTSPCFSLFTVLFAYVGFFGYFVIRDCVDVAVDGILRISIYHPPPPPLLTPSLFVWFCFFSRSYQQFSV